MPSHRQRPTRCVFAFPLLAAEQRFVNGIATSNPDAYTPPMQKWEYKVLKRTKVSQEKLNVLGSEGWELMNFVLPQCNIPGSFDEIDVEIVLRRPLAE